MLTQNINKVRQYVAFIVAVGLSGFTIYTAVTGILPAAYQRGIHLTMALILVYLSFSFVKKSSIFSMIVDGILICLSVASLIYLMTEGSPQQMVEKAITGLLVSDIIVGFIIILLLVEATRRISLPIAILVIVSILYGFFGRYIPGFFNHRGYSMEQMVEHQVYTTAGIYGVPLDVAATFVALFVIFGAFLEVSGGGKTLTDLAFSLTGRSRSGPALSAVSASGIMGSINGTGVGNVVTSGTFTIPLMKKMGYKPKVAGAIESVASIGGQLLPPIMGASAFLMAEILGIPYGSVVLAAIIPALLYFFSIGIVVHLEAYKNGLTGMKKSELPKIKSMLLQSFLFFIPIGIIIYMVVVANTSLNKAGLFAIIATIIISWFKKHSRINFSKLIEGLKIGGRNMLHVSISCAAAGVIIGVISLAGIGLKISSFITQISQGSLVLSLFLTMIVCIILGMGVPTVAAYIITSVLATPALIQLGVEPLVAHLFVFYFAVISGITPPVAIASFAGAGIARSGQLETAITSTKLGIAAYIIPYLFVYNTTLLMQGVWYNIIYSIVTAIIAIIFIGMATQGWGLARLKWYERICIFASAVMMFFDWYIFLLGMFLAILILTLQWIRVTQEGHKISQGIHNKI
jgi:TRAP transporter 4TM/12TM fusion protein